MKKKQKERHRDEQSTLPWYEFHFTSIQRTSSVTYFAARKAAQHKLPQLKLGPTIYAIGLPVQNVKEIQKAKIKIRNLRGKFTSTSSLKLLATTVMF